MGICKSISTGSYGGNFHDKALNRSPDVVCIYTYNRFGPSHMPLSRYVHCCIAISIPDVRSYGCTGPSSTPPKAAETPACATSLNPPCTLCWLGVHQGWRARGGFPLQLVDIKSLSK